ncbi:hypothetical protein Sjap_014455 [Stephania japonica]|uniref:GRAM domain-containing protein n=1 Tax=Stephania japonica TaxID=461633 RepID=A0AAP0NQF5_9MAGN
MKNQTQDQIMTVSKSITPDQREHGKLGPKISETLKRKLTFGARIVRGGGMKRIFKKLFNVGKEEKLLKVWQCYLSTTAGPIAGLLFISTEKVAFCSERSLQFNSPTGEIVRAYYKVLIPIRKMKRANQRENAGNPREKYIEIVTVDNFDFWFMGFVNYQKALNLKLGPKISETVKGKLSWGARLVQGGVQGAFTHLFSVEEGEKLLKVSQCYLYTTAGPFAGLLFISTEKIAFCRKLGPKISETLKRKLTFGARVVRGGGMKRIFKKLFNVGKEEKLLKVYQCYLSTTAGPIAGLLFVSTEKVTFCSERSLRLTSPTGEIVRAHYKVLIPIRKIKRANQSENARNPREKYIEIVTVDNFDFWFMGFVNYQKALNCLQQTVSQSSIKQIDSRRNVALPLLQI